MKEKIYYQWLPGTNDAGIVVILDKIYIEDYAVTYLNQIARSPETKSGYAGLFGHCRVVDGKKEFYIYRFVCWYWRV